MLQPCFYNDFTLESGIVICSLAINPIARKKISSIVLTLLYRFVIKKFLAAVKRVVPFLNKTKIQPFYNQLTNSL